MAPLRNTNGRPAQTGRARSSYSPGTARERVAPGPVDLTQPLVDAEHVARLLCVKRKRVYELARRPSDPLPCVRIGGAVRFVLLQVEEWVAGQAPD
jgi:predicted DNA-binding transcriptional regulator AlpA